MSVSDPRTLLQQACQAALSAALPSSCLSHYLPDSKQLPQGRVIVIGAGKAAASMAAALEQHYAGTPDVLDRIEGLVITRYGQSVPCTKIQVLEAAHPVPDQAGMEGAQQMLSMLEGLNEKDQVIALISGGGSSLLTLPAQGITLEDKQGINKALLMSGASISEMNCVRKHLSAVKGGRLAKACFPAALLTLLISDVPGDDPQIIASGPTVADSTNCADALAILDKYTITRSQQVNELLQSGKGETPKPEDEIFSGQEVKMVATPLMALEQAAAFLQKKGITPYILSDAIEGEASSIGEMHGAMALHVANHNQPFVKPCVILSGGETTVTIKEKTNGKGGRNVEFLLALAKTLDGAENIDALAIDTDGVDGSMEIAGGYIDSTTIQRANDKGISITDALERHDGHGFFQALGDSIITGPTNTNVNDFRAIYIG